MDNEEHDSLHYEGDRESYFTEGISRNVKYEVSYERDPLSEEQGRENFSTEGALGSGKSEFSYEHIPPREEWNEEIHSDEDGSKGARPKFSSDHDALREERDRERDSNESGFRSAGSGFSYNPPRSYYTRKTKKGTMTSRVGQPRPLTCIVITRRWVYDSPINSLVSVLPEDSVSQSNRKRRRRRKGKQPAGRPRRRKASLPNGPNIATYNDNVEGPSNAAENFRRPPPPDDTEYPVPFYERPPIRPNLPRRRRFPGRNRKEDSEMGEFPRDRSWQDNHSVLNDPSPSPRRDRVAALSQSTNPFLRDKKWVDHAFMEVMSDPSQPWPPPGQDKVTEHSLKGDPVVDKRKGPNDVHRDNKTTVESLKAAGRTASVVWQQTIPRLTTPDDALLPAWSTVEYNIGNGQVSELTRIFSAENYRDILGESFTSVYRAGPPPRHEMHAEEFYPITWL